MAEFRVEIEWRGAWYAFGPAYSNRDAAEWDIAVWRQANGSNGQDTGFRVRESGGLDLAAALDYGREGRQKGENQ